MTQYEVARERLTAWIRDYGEIKGPQFIADLQAVMAEVERLRAVVDRLPHTADGVPVLPGDTVCAVFGGDLVEEVTLQDWRHALPGKSGGKYPGCYSTREAAEAARETH